MNMELILNTDIQGGVIGTTLSSRHNISHLQTMVDS